MKIVFNITTDTDLSLLVAITEDGGIMVKDTNRTGKDSMLLSEDWYSSTLGGVGSSYARNIAKCVAILRDLDACEHPDTFDTDLLLENIREGIAALLIDSSHKDATKYWRNLRGSIIAALDVQPTRAKGGAK